MDEFLKTLLIACIPSIITGLVTYFVAHKNASSQISVVKEQNKHDIDKLMKQHQIDIDNLKEAHKLEMESKEQDHKNRLDLQQKEFENSLLKQQKDGENVMTAEALKGMFSMFGSTINTAIDTPEGKQLLSDSIRKAIKNQRKE